MAITLNSLSTRLKELSIDKLHGADFFLKGIHLLIEHAQSPWSAAVHSLCPPSAVFSNLLKSLQQKVPHRDVNICTAFALQHAYLSALQTVLEQETPLFEARCDLDAPVVTEEGLRELTRQIEQLWIWKIEPLQLKFPDLPQEPLIKMGFETVTELWLKMRVFRHDIQAYEASNFARRISYQFYPQLLQVVATYRDFYAPLAEHFQTAGYWESPEIGLYKASLLQLPAQPVLTETFALRDIYVDVNATHITQLNYRLRYGASEAEAVEPYEKGTPVPLMQAILHQLEDREHVVCIQAESGAGKTVFCRMLAARVAANYPEWLPILVDLRDERFTIHRPLEEAVRAYLQPLFDLTPDLLQTRRVLFILDGFDECTAVSDPGETLKQFFGNLSAFQTRCAQDHRWRHKIIITGRPIKIQEIEPALPENFLRLNVEPMEHLQVIAWLSNWEKLFGPHTTNNFTTLLENANVFQEDLNLPHPLQQVTGDPLCLYLLATMHRHGVLTQAEISETTTLTSLYHRVISWVCGAIGTHPDHQRSQRILSRQGLSPLEIRQVLQEIAFCIWHEGQSWVPMTHLTTYLSSAVPQEAKKLLNSDLDGLHNLLISFAFQPQPGASQRIGFSHKSFGEYLAAEKMAKSLGQIGKSRPATEDGSQPQSPLQDAAHRFYSVFGGKLLTDEMWEYVMNILTEQYTPDELVRLTERLYHLYIEYSDGRWMNEDIARTQWGVLRRYEIPIDLLKFEVQVGINLFVLLCLLYWKTDGIFDICGRAQEETFDPNRFRKLLAFGEVVGTFGLFRRIHHLLKKVSMPEANLVCMNFRRANLQWANLQAAVLRDGNLRNANLQETNLQSADLRVASLQNTNLQKADLRNANLEDCDLRNADLTGANLEGANLLCVEARDANFSQANLQKAVLYGANLQGANFQDAVMAGAIISQHQLERDRHLFSAEQIASLNVVHD